MKRILAAVAVAAGATPVALAQSASATAATEAAPLAIAPYRSAFAGFRPFSDEAPQDWRRVNDEMRKLGGHAGHLRAPPDAPVRKPGHPETPPAASGAQEKER